MDITTDDMLKKEVSSELKGVEAAKVRFLTICRYALLVSFFSALLCKKK